MFLNPYGYAIRKIGEPCGCFCYCSCNHVLPFELVKPENLKPGDIVMSDESIKCAWEDIEWERVV